MAEKDTTNTITGQNQGSSAQTVVNEQLKEQAVANKAKELNLAYINLSKFPINSDVFQLIDINTAEKNLIIPFFISGKKVRIAFTDPDKEETKKIIEDLRTKGYLLNFSLSSDTSIKNAIQGIKSKLVEHKEIITKNLINEEKIASFDIEIQNLQDLKYELEKLTSEEGLNKINVGALKTGASDIHYQPEDNGVVTVRFRIDGMMHNIFEIDQKIYKNLVNQLKYKAGMQLNVDNIPQDGRYYLLVNDRKIDIRVSALPTEYGETFVCRLLDKKGGFIDIKTLGLREDNLNHVQKSCQISHGMILVTGPTGSGKTTTLYSMLEQFNDPSKKIITLEDPIEYHLKGISQSQTNAKRGYTFSAGLKSILRQDPDVVMVGEIRDEDTAETAVQAALTGHVLLSTLHTNSAIGTIPRILNFGIKPFMLAPALHIIIAQRLVRKICENCKVLQKIDDSTKKEIEESLHAMQQIKPDLKNIIIPDKLPRGAGCDKCSKTGYRGRVQITEILTIDFQVRDLILKEASQIKFIELARQKGMLTMREDGILKILAGITTLDEV